MTVETGKALSYDTKRSKPGPTVVWEPRGAPRVQAATRKLFVPMSQGVSRVDALLATCLAPFQSHRMCAR